jgi:hypothetical protein
MRVDIWNGPVGKRGLVSEGPLDGVDGWHELLRIR